GHSETWVRLGQDGEELPFLAGSQAFEHDRILSQSRGVYNLASFAGKARPYKTESKPPKPGFADSRVQGDRRNPTHICMRRYEFRRQTASIQQLLAMEPSPSPLSSSEFVTGFPEDNSSWELAPPPKYELSSRPKR